MPLSWPFSRSGGSPLRRAPRVRVLEQRARVRVHRRRVEAGRGAAAGAGVRRPASSSRRVGAPAPKPCAAGRGVAVAGTAVSAVRRASATARRRRGRLRSRDAAVCVPCRRAAAELRTSSAAAMTRSAYVSGGAPGSGAPAVRRTGGRRRDAARTRRSPRRRARRRRGRTRLRDGCGRTAIGCGRAGCVRHRVPLQCRETPKGFAPTCTWMVGTLKGALQRPRSLDRARTADRRPYALIRALRVGGWTMGSRAAPRVVARDRAMSTRPAFIDAVPPGSVAPARITTRRRARRQAAHETFMPEGSFAVARLHVPSPLGRRRRARPPRTGPARSSRAIKEMGFTGDLYPVNPKARRDRRPQVLPAPAATSPATSTT